MSMFMTKNGYPDSKIVRSKEHTALAVGMRDAAKQTNFCDGKAVWKLDTAAQADFIMLASDLTTKRKSKKRREVG